MVDNMINAFYKIRNWKFKVLYKYILKPIFFRLDPEDVHDHIIRLGTKIGDHGFTRNLTSFSFNYSNPILNQNILGINFRNPIGLAAGFDKDANLTQILPLVGFGFEEIGSITGEMCEGNPRPRLWRLKKSKSLLVYYGLKNQGSEILSSKLKFMRFDFPIGTSLAKTNCKETAQTEEGVKDYVKAFDKFKDIGDYTTLNISCPNAYGGQPFTDKMSLDLLLTETDKIKTSKPTFIKLSPDLTTFQIDEILEVIGNHNIVGIICGNLTKNRDNPELIDQNIPAVGGVGGFALRDLSNNQLKYVYQKTKGEYILVGCGGISSAEDSYTKIKLGASLLQLVTGLVYEGPQLISEINMGLVELLKRDGYKNISEAIGVENK